MTDQSLKHISTTKHRIKSFCRGIYRELGESVESIELWDECQDCKFKTNEVIRQRIRIKD